MTLSLRARLAGFAAITAGSLFAIVFVAVVAETQANFARSGRQTLASALMQASTELTQNPHSPDLAEITSTEPDLAIAAFDPKGKLISWSGPLQVETEPSGGFQEIRGISCLTARTSTQVGTVAGALVWIDKRTEVEHLGFLLALAWIPLTSCVALATWLGSKSTFRHLASMTDQASQMGKDLSDRLPVPADPELGRFATRLNELLDRISVSARLQERFVADAAHELRTPLAILLGNIDSVLQKPRQPDEYRQTLKRIQDETARLASLVEMVLLSAGSVNDEAPVTELSASVEQAHARWVDQFASKNISLCLMLNDVSARIEPREIGVVLDNLLSNGLKSSPSGSSCSISLVKEGDCAKIEVSDEGPGVPPELRERVFDRFVRDSTERRRDGFGIGLSICRRIIEGRGGTITLDTSAAGGARFVILLNLSHDQRN